MKTLAQYMSLPYPMEIIPDNEGFVGLIPDLPGCISSGGTVDEAVKGLQEAKELWIEAKIDAKEPIPEPSSIEDYSGKFVLRIPKSLHRSLDAESRRQSVSLNQYIMHLLSVRNATQELEGVLTSIVEVSVERGLNGYLNKCRVANTCQDQWNLGAAPSAQMAGEAFWHHGAGVILEPVGPDIISMIEHAPLVPRRISTQHNPSDRARYEKAAHH